MDAIHKPKAVFIYCFQVWITGILLGPIISFIWATKYNQEEWFGYEIFITLYSALFSIPGLLLFSGAAAFLFVRTWPVYLKRLLLGIWGIVLTVSTFQILFQESFSIHMAGYPGSFCYILPSFLSIWVYRWPQSMK
jgi:hypothetical protein